MEVGKGSRAYILHSSLSISLYDRKTSSFLFSVVFWVGEIGSSSSPIRSSKISGCSPKGSSNSHVVREGSFQSSKKSEG